MAMVSMDGILAVPQLLCANMCVHRCDDVLGVFSGNYFCGINWQHGGLVGPPETLPAYMGVVVSSTINFVNGVCAMILPRS